MIFWLECLEFSPEIHYNSLNSFGEREFIMKFYSYDYVLSQISQQNWVTIGISGLLILLTGFIGISTIANSVNYPLSRFWLWLQSSWSASAISKIAKVIMTNSNVLCVLLRLSQRSWMSKKKMSMSILQQPQMGRSWRLERFITELSQALTQIATY